jgi:hypothetical protein
VSAPEFTSGNGMGALPEFGIGGLFAPLGAEIAIIELIHFERNPTAEMDAISDMTDGNFGFRKTVPERIPHGAADGAVEFADGIAVGSETKSENGHAEIFVVVVGILAAESKKFVAGDAETAVGGGEVVIHEAGGEIVVPCGDGSMRGEYETGGSENAGFRKGEMLGVHDGANAFEGEERGVAFVHVKDGWTKAKSFKGANAKKNSCLRRISRSPP